MRETNDLIGQALHRGEEARLESERLRELIRNLDIHVEPTSTESERADK